MSTILASLPSILVSHISHPSLPVKDMKCTVFTYFIQPNSLCLGKGTKTKVKTPFLEGKFLQEHYLESNFLNKS